MTVSRAETRRRVSRFTETCRRRGLKVTHQRMEVFRELAASDEHPDAETIYERVRARLPTVSRDTVYRTLSALEAQGLVSRTDVLGGPARYDANTAPHHHFVCTACGRISDFRSEALDALPIPRSVESLGRIESAHVQVRGVCSTCAARKRRAGRRRRR
ncbi:MAG: transcriptional repressor [Planctomycetes bacterium]|nr:transcriptional repressor [Planctomycetota bacterium]